MRKLTIAVAMLLCTLCAGAKETVSIFTSVDARRANVTQPLAADAVKFFSLGIDQVGIVRSQNDVRIAGLEINSKNITLDVQQFQLFDEHATLVEGSSEGEKTLAQPDLSFFKGVVQGEENSFVYFSLSHNEVQGFIEISGSRYLLSPAGANICALYAETAASPVTKSWDCLSNDPSFPPNTILSDSSSLSPLVTVKIALEADYETYKYFHNSVDTTTAYLAALYGGVAAIYERDAGVRLRISFLRVWSAVDDPYTAKTISGALSEFKNYWIASQALTERAAAQFISMKEDISGGLAYVDALCSSTYGYSVSGIDGGYSYPSNGYVWDLHVTAHELGHVFGARHSHSCSWSPAIDSCYTSEAGCNQTIVPTVGGIMSYCHVYGNGVNLKFHPKVAAYIHGKATNAACTEGAISEISLPNGPYNVGAVVSGSTKNVDIPVYNPSAITLRITNLHFTGVDSGNFQIANGSKSLTVLAGTMGKIPVKFSPRSVGSLSATLEFSDNTAGTKSNLLVTGTGNAPASGVGEETAVAQAALYQNFPNPFSLNSSTVIRFDLLHSAPVMLTLVNMLGETVRTIASGEYPAGSHEVTLSVDGLAAGVYEYRLETNDTQSSRLMIRM